MTYIALPPHWSPPSLSGGLLADEWWSGPSVRYLRCDEDAFDILEHRRAGSDYLIHAGTLGDLSRPGPEVPLRGTTAALAVDLVTEAPSSKAVVVDVAVVEFNDRGEKSRVAFVAANTPTVHEFRGDCERFRLALRIRGAGRIRLRHVGVAPLTEGTRSAWNDPAGVAPFVAALMRRAAPLAQRSQEDAPGRPGAEPSTWGMFDPLVGGTVLWPAEDGAEGTRRLARSLESSGEQWLRREALSEASDAEVEATAAHHVVSTAGSDSGRRRLTGLLSRGLSVVTDQSAWVRRDFPEVHAVPVEQDLGFLGRPMRRHEAAARTSAAWEATDRRECDSPTRPRLKVLALLDSGGGAHVPPAPHCIDLLVRSVTDFPVPEALDAFCRTEGVDVLVPLRTGDRHGRHYLHSRVLPFLSLDVVRVVQTLTMDDVERRQLAGEPLTEILAGCHVDADAAGADVFTSGLSLSAAPASAWLWGVPSCGPSFAVDPFELDCPPGMLFGDPDPDDVTDGTEGPELTVVLPVYNNGRHLLDTALPSLARQECWSRMHIVLVDDGSTDGTTPDVCRSLAEHCPRISTHLFGDGGSGSASRPRNWGVDHARTELVTFLDPDNEISPGGYDRLLDLYAEGAEAGRAPDLVSGFQVKVDDDVRVMARHAFGDREVRDARREFFRGRHFPTVSTQAAVLRTDFLRSSGIRFVESASGEDTLYGWEVLLAAENAVLTDRAHLVYVADRADSVTNDASARLFRKHLVVEHARREWLRENDLLETFCRGQLQRSLDAWYRPLLERVVPGERVEAEEVLAEIVALYPVPDPTADSSDEPAAEADVATDSEPRDELGEHADGAAGPGAAGDGPSSVDSG